MANANFDLSTVLATWLLGVVLLLWLPFALANMAFGPLLVRRTYVPLERVHFRIADLFVLLVHLQLSAALVMSLASHWTLLTRLLLWWTLATAQAGWWLAGLCWLAPWPEITGRRRLWTLAVIVPLGFLCGAALFPGIICAMLTLLMFVIIGFSIEGPSVLGYVVLQFVFCLCPLFGVLFVRQLCWQVIAASQRNTEQKAAAASDNREANPASASEARKNFP